MESDCKTVHANYRKKFQANRGHLFETGGQSFVWLTSHIHSRLLDQLRARLPGFSVSFNFLAQTITVPDLFIISLLGIITTVCFSSSIVYLSLYTGIFLNLNFPQITCDWGKSQMTHWLLAKTNRKIVNFCFWKENLWTVSG